MKLYLRLLLILGITISAPQIVSAQQHNKDKTYQFKVYYNFSNEQGILESVTDESIRLFTNASTNFGRLSPAFAITKNRVRHEVELSNIGVKRDEFEEEAIYPDFLVTTAGATNWELNLALRYEVSFNFLRPSSKHGAYFGASVQPYYTHQNMKPKTSAVFPLKIDILGTRLHFVPRYTYDFGKKWFLDVNFPVEIMNISGYRTYENNPILTEDERLSTDIEGDLFDNVFQFRIGIGMKL